MEREWKPRATDVIITTPPKAGTTLMTQICHVLRTGGTGGAAPAFEDIHQVVPFTHIADALGQDLNAEQIAAPRLFKAHLSLSRLPVGSRFIVATREPLALVSSIYAYYVSMWTKPKVGPIDDFARSLPDNMYLLMREGFQRRAEPSVCLVPYELMVQQKEATVRKVASVMGIEPLEPRLIEAAIAESSREYMLEHASHFTNHWTFRTLREHGNAHAYTLNGQLPSASPKVTVGADEDNRDTLGPEGTAFVLNKWRRLVGDHIGHATYADMLSAVRAEWMQLLQA
mmetsp:Transcript_17413/g.45024  ORF Transcript_17413/g.45024 Transcript_17413/m.45024 type:complete len:285 (+) Transcript_17413:125-979(+)